MISRRRGRRAAILGILSLARRARRGQRLARRGERPEHGLPVEPDRRGHRRRSGPTQIEGLIYMSYTQLAVYDAVVAIEGGYEPYGAALSAPAGASARRPSSRPRYETLVHYFPASFASARTRRGHRRSRSIAATAGEGGRHRASGPRRHSRSSPCALATACTPDRRTGRRPRSRTRTPVPGVWRLTPPAYAAPQIPWAGDVTPFVTASARPVPARAPARAVERGLGRRLQRGQALGQNSSTIRTATQTADREVLHGQRPAPVEPLVRDIAASRSLGLLETARLAAMINTVGADAGIAVMNAKYHFLFWRPVTAIDPTSVQAAGDGFGPTPGFDDGNPRRSSRPAGGR